MRAIKLIILLLLPTTILAQSRITNEKGEKWWYQPISEFGDLANIKDSCATAPAFVSSLGRYIYSGADLNYCIGEGGIDFTTGKISAVKQGRTLRDATLMLSQRADRESAIAYSTTFVANCTPSTLERFIELIPQVTKERGDIIIKSWDSRDGELTFSDSRMEPLIAQLKEAGFRVVLEIDPLLSPDSQMALEAVEHGDVVMIDNTTPLMVKHSKGYSLLYDLTKDSSSQQFNRRLKEFKDRYNFDGYYLNLERVEPYMGSPIFYDQTTIKSLGKSYVQKIDSLAISNIVTDSKDAVIFKPYSSNIIEEAIQEEIASAYGKGKHIVVDSKDSDIYLYLSRVFIPRREMVITDSFEKDIEIYKKGEALREKASKYTDEVIKEEQKTGAPIVRAIEYEFPGKGFSNCTDQYMIGNRFIIAPHSSGSSRMVRLPTGRWKDSNGAVFKGPAVISAPQSDIIPYYERIKK